ncbi:hypothetical protein [Andreprevotia sp. IGB-42]|uniref:hypothetical protein n=1 Tax=Andreprevotia sp. IGB-42 TaxID=2497473 RepID=UPI0013578655|nr:hypothetical protein [Andreprevotia sp. IGB-42]
MLRQRTRKQDILAPAWARAHFAFDIDRYSGTAILIEAQSLVSLAWSNHVTVEQERELARLQSDGHLITRSRRKVELTPNVPAMRNTVLFRSMLFEIGNHIDFARTGPDEWQRRPASQKKDFAHRHASECYQRLSRAGHVPFAAIIDAASLAQDGLRREWFAFEEPA